MPGPTAEWLTSVGALPKAAIMTAVAVVTTAGSRLESLQARPTATLVVPHQVGTEDPVRAFEGSVNTILPSCRSLGLRVFYPL
ncbi:MAG: hypothetical protein FIA90_03245 [candidate division NC10 bacterium]|nr:hypothetical protein [candidate division NC10 bacterium]